jgi:hypothetical protein
LSTIVCNQCFSIYKRMGLCFEVHSVFRCHVFIISRFCRLSTIF